MQYSLGPQYKFASYTRKGEIKMNIKDLSERSKKIRLHVKYPLFCYNFARGKKSQNGGFV